MKQLGIHIISQFYQCQEEILNNSQKIEEILLESCEKANATVIQHTFYQFSPQGVSGIVLLAQSHVSIHTWPEYKYAMVDILTCGDKADPWIIFEEIKERLKSTQFNKTQLTRGVPLSIIEENKEESK